ncbi:hypothetical protein [Brevibacterium aurantiacum]|uniref:DUF3800 domain-containing protein n=1 Tax=Brevibacterium aurantiacum TaxID=273384 RepID=A0A2A3X0J8_BREAU|nr:hypothetical protein [Brevibacterium aurantiacum]MDN5585192.1 hypothetical protein [Brevibacterium sp.]PCC17188.1 hypothetical protein CIK79_02065 [Brevibacterium aurantiacum]PCC48685.1 hypothetical protein CIK62_16625 [Brevibacterium aurantiacum]PCC57179.1 hypothetical protein CIK58_10655 [Brevibacterium aurantiacum]RCS89837.1 hypothetical protein CIK63_07305 [Brevibacterium aurantiacum]
MTPPAGPGQVRSLQTHYDKIGDGFVGFIDETYHLEKDGRGRFYTIAAVVVAAADLEPLRQDLDNIVPGGWWHTSNQLQNDQGYEDTLKLLATLEPSSDVCVIVDHVDVSDNVDADEGLTVRAEVLGNLLIALHQAESPMHGPVQLAVAEENRRARVNNFDRSIRQSLIKKGSLPETVGLMHASPGSEHLLWLPDVVCSAYRQDKLGRDSELFDEIRDLTDVRKLS